jgi:hypothetical protein
MRFEYDLSGKGWADGCIEINSNIVYFSTSYLTDSLDDMLKALISLIPEVSSYPVSVAQFEWHEEPGGTVWCLRRNGEVLSVEIVSFEDLLRRKKQTVELNETCPLIDFSMMVVQALDLLLKQYGLEGYKEKWVNHDFPMENYLKLKGLTG